MIVNGLIYLELINAGDVKILVEKYPPRTRDKSLRFIGSLILLVSTGTRSIHGTTKAPTRNCRNCWG